MANSVTSFSPLPSLRLKIENNRHDHYLAMSLTTESYSPIVRIYDDAFLSNSHKICIRSLRMYHTKIRRKYKIGEYLLTKISLYIEILSSFTICRSIYIYKYAWSPQCEGSPWHWNTYEIFKENITNLYVQNNTNILHCELPEFPLNYWNQNFIFKRRVKEE